MNTIILYGEIVHTDPDKGLAYINAGGTTYQLQENYHRKGDKVLVQGEASVGHMSDMTACISIKPALVRVIDWSAKK